MADTTINTDARRFDWDKAARDLDAHGCALLPGLLTAGEAGTIAGFYEKSDLFRSKVVMARHGFGQGEYQYFAYPLPQEIQTLRTAMYAQLAPIANRWAAALGTGQRFPKTLKHYLKACHEAGQTRPTPLLLKYGVGDYNRLHQDLYGGAQFPLQIAVLLSEPNRDFEGGEFVLTEQRPRSQSRAEVVPLRQGDGVVFAVNERPAHGARGVYRLKMRHGVSRVRSGERLTLGLIFHDAA